MALLSTMTIMPQTRLKSEVVYTTNPNGRVLPETVLTYDRSNSKSPKFTEPSVMFTGGPAPKKVVVVSDAALSLTRYYVYDTRLTRVGNYTVKTESGVKVVYMPSTASGLFLSGYVIGSLPWSTLTSATKYFIGKLLRLP